MRFTPIASSSAGNAYLVQDGDCALLLECGISMRRLMQGTDVRLSGLSGCLITHEHKDHAGHVARLIRMGVPCWASPGTVRALGQEGITPFCLPAGRNMGPPFQVGSFTVVPFRTFHDAAEPVGYLLRDSRGEVLVFATDTAGLGYRFPGVSVLALEANYQDEIIACSSMPEERRKRVRSSHMEIGVLCEYLAGLELEQCRELWLLHLSDSSSHEARFIAMAEEAVPAHVIVRAAQRG